MGNSMVELQKEKKTKLGKFEKESVVIVGNRTMINYRLNHMQGKITEMWLANEEGIFS